MPLTAEKNRIDFVFSVIPQAAGTKTCINTGSGVAETPHRFSDGLSDNNGFMDALQKQAEKLWKILNDIQTATPGLRRGCFGPASYQVIISIPLCKASLSMAPMAWAMA